MSLHLHALEGVLRRVAAGAARERLVLRGGLVVRHWAGPIRPVADVDFLARFPFDAAATAALLDEVCRAPDGDGLALALERTEVIWAETAFPGVRGVATARGGGERVELQIDVGFGDPLVPAPALLELGGARVLACRAETLFGWKVHGLFERGPGRWRPKDLFDLWLLARHAPLDPEVLSAAVRAAFEHRGDSPALADRLLTGTWGQSAWSRHKWASFRKSRPEGSVPEDAAEVVTFVAAMLRPILGPTPR